MPSHKHCAKHRYIGAALEVLREEKSVMIECSHCSKTYVTEKPCSIKTLSQRTLPLCSHCQSQVRCVRCKKKVGLESGAIAECVRCGTANFFCKKCSTTLLLLPHRHELERHEMGKLSVVVERLMQEVVENEHIMKLLQNKKNKLFSQSPFVFFFNIIVPEITGEINEENLNDNEEHGDDKGW